MMKHQAADMFAEEFESLLDELSSEETITKLEEEIKTLKSEIDINLKNHNISVDVLNRIYAHLSREKQNLKRCEDNLKSFMNAKEVDEIKQLQATCKEKQIQIERISQFDRYFKQVFQLVQYLQEVKDKCDARQFWDAHQCIDKAQELLEEIEQQKDTLFPNSTSQPNLVADFEFVVNKLKTDINIVYEKFIYDLIQVFKENISFEKEPGCDLKVFRCSFLSVMSEQEYECYIKCLVQQKDQFRLYLRNTFDQLSEHFVKHFLLQDKSTVFVNKDHNQVTSYDRNCDRIKLSHSDTSPDQAKLDRVKNFIKDIISLLTLDRSISCSSEFVKLIGDIWSDQIFSCLIKYYFESRMPRVESQFEQFAEVLDEGHQLELFMKSIGMMEENNQVLADYTSNIKEHFSAKLSQDFIIRTKNLLKSDLNDLVSSEKALEGLKLKCKARLPSLKVSRFMVDIKELLEEMSALFTSSSANLKILLAETFVNVCELFVDISPFLFKVNIERNPRQNALFHNNCQFFGYLIECVVLSHKPRLDSLAEFIPAVRNLASQVFLNQMQYQEKLLLSFIKNDVFSSALQLIADEIPSTDLKVSSQSHFEFRQCINNCLKHLSTLHTAFVDILPEKICDKAFTTLIASFLSQFLSSIIELNDISSLGASHLSHELDYFSKELKQFLANSENLVSKWMKMNEINFILKSSLLEIVNRWADGKGLLANYLTADEVKHMIRALFQNNERRSNALAKIK